MLVCYCKERLRRKGSNRNPSLRTIEKEAYTWAEQGINTLEEAAAYMQAQNARHTRTANLMRLLQISGRNLTPAEERYAQAWLDMDFDSQALQMAYEKTCLNTGGLKWPYMNKILQSWHQQNLHTGAQIQAGDKKPAPQAQRVQAGTAALGQMEREAIARMLPGAGTGGVTNGIHRRGAASGPGASGPGQGGAGVGKCGAPAPGLPTGAPASRN